MERYPWSAEEEDDLREMHRDAFLARYPHRKVGSWRNKRKKLGLHANPALDQHGNPWQVRPEAPQPEMRPNVAPVSPDAGVTPIREPVVESIVGVKAGERPDVSAIVERAARQFESAARTAERKANQHIYFDHGPVAIFFVGDQHIGAPGTDVKQMLHEQELINATPGAHVMLTGDIMENAIVQKLLTLNMHQRTTQDEDFILAKHYVSQFRSLMGVLGGNHTYWSTRAIGLNIDEMMVPDGVIFDQDDISLTVHIGPHEVSVRARHKWQGSSIYSATHGQERAARFDTARHDVYVGAHIHRGAVAREFVVDRKRKLALLSSTYKHIDGYQAQVGFSRNDMSTAVGLVINNDGSFWGSGNIAAIMNYMKQVYDRAA